MISRRRLTVLSLAATTLFVGACTASNANEAAPPPSPTIGGVGVPPTQLDSPDGQVQPPIETASSFVLDPGNTPQIDDNRVFMVGDSVMKAMTLGNPDALDYSVGALGWDVTVDAVVGRFTDQGLRVLEKRPDEIHQVVVLMLGNNYNGDEQNFRELINQIRDTLVDTRKIVMFTVPEYEPKQKEVNAVLRQAAADDPRFVLIDWEAITRTVKGVLSGDGIHPTEYGAEVLAQLIGNALGKAPGAGPDVTLPIVGSTDHGPLPDSVQRNHDSPSGTDRHDAAHQPHDVTSPRERIGERELRRLQQRGQRQRQRGWRAGHRSAADRSGARRHPAGGDQSAAHQPPVRVRRPAAERRRLTRPRPARA